jgi:hypothetical protein
MNWRRDWKPTGARRPELDARAMLIPSTTFEVERSADAPSPRGWFTQAYVLANSMVPIAVAISTLPTAALPRRSSTSCGAARFLHRDSGMRNWGLMV